MEVFKHLALSKLCVQLNLLQRQRMNLRGQGMNEAVGINQRSLKFAFPFLILRSFELSNEIKNQLLFLERIKHETNILRLSFWLESLMLQKHLTSLMQKEQLNWGDRYWHQILFRQHLSASVPFDTLYDTNKFINLVPAAGKPVLSCNKEARGSILDSANFS